MATTTTYDTEGSHTHQLDSSTDQVIITCRGGNGASGDTSYPHGEGGTGGEVQATFAVEDLSTTTLDVFVAGDGSRPSGGFHGGGNGGNGSGTLVAGGGGGASEVRPDGGGATSYLAIAGGGAGGGAGTGTNGGAGSDGGNGGAPDGQDGNDANTAERNASGGTGGTSGASGYSAGGNGGYESDSESGAGGGGGGAGAASGSGGGATAVFDEGAGAGGGGGASDTAAFATGVSYGTASATEVVIEERAIPAAPNNAQADIIDDDSAQATWNADTSEGTIDTYEVEVSQDMGAWTDAATVSSGTTSHTETISRSTDAVKFRVRAVNSLGASAWTESETETTNAENPVVDAVTATTLDLSWIDPSDNDGADILLATSSGSVRSDYTVAKSVDATVSSTTLSELDADTTYYLRVQATYTGGDGTAAPLSSEESTTTGPTSTITPTVISAGETSVTIESDLGRDADSSTTVTLERREQFRDGFGAWRDAATTQPAVGARSAQLQDTGAQPSTTYDYRFVIDGDGGAATTGIVEATTEDDGVRSDQVPAEGWHVVVEDGLGNTFTPTIVGSPSMNDVLNDLPTCEVPVEPSARWSDSAEWERAPMRVYHDGERRAIEEVQRIRQEPGRSVIVGVGGVELRERVALDVIEQDAHLAVEDLITTETGLVANVDDPAAETTADLLQQSADSEIEWDGVLASPPTASDVFETTSTGRLRSLQTAYFEEAEGGSYQGGDQVFDQQSSIWSGSSFIEFEASGATVNHKTTVTTDHEMPADTAQVALRTQVPNDGHPGFRVLLDGTEVLRVPPDTFGSSESDPGWSRAAQTLSTALPAGSHDVYIDFSTLTEDGSVVFDPQSSADNPALQLDCVLLSDDRFDAGYGETVVDGVLQGVHEYPPAVEVQTTDAVSVRQVVGGRLSSTWNNTTNGQAVAISNDSGGTWIEAQNSETVEGAFGSGSTSIRARFTLSGYDSDPSASPAGRTAPQSVDLYSLYADLEDTPLLANRSWDQSIRSILQDIASYGNFIFELRWSDSAGGLALEWTQAGQRTATADPALVDYSVNTDYSSIHRKAIIYGTSIPRSDTVTAQHGTWVPIKDDWLLETGETVAAASDGTEYERGVDYELRPNAGEVKALATGAITDGADVDVSYDQRIRGSFESDDYAGSYETFVDSVPAITTARNADAAALALVQEANEPLVTASVTIDVEPGGLSLVEAIDLDQLPVDEPLEVWSVDNSPGQVTLQLGSREEISETISRIQERLGATSRKV